MHAVSQQTPSTQKPDTHSGALLHESPLVFLTLHVPESQKAFEPQSEAIAQGAAHPVSAQGDVPQSVAWAVAMIVKERHL